MSNPNLPGALRELARLAAQLLPGTGWPVVVEFRDPLTGQRHTLRLLPPDEGTPPAVEGDAHATHGDYPPGELPPMAANALEAATDSWCESVALCQAAGYVWGGKWRGVVAKLERAGWLERDGLKLRVTAKGRGRLREHHEAAGDEE